jgi:hypothetical protein
MSNASDTEKALADFYANRPDPSMLKATDSRKYSAHHLLLITAKIAAEATPSDRADERRLSLTAIVMSALALEALVNAAGEELIEHWDDFDKLSPWGKLRLVATHLNFDLDAGKQPWQDIKWLIRLRNDIAHARPEKILTERWLTREEMRAEIDGEVIHYPESTLEKKLTQGGASRAVGAVNRARDILCDALPKDQYFQFPSDGWGGAYEVPPEEPTP